MSDEESFQAALDADPLNHLLRMVFADWLDDRDDPRGPGYRELGSLQVSPMRIRIKATTRSESRVLWGWTSTQNWFIVHAGRGQHDYAYHALPVVWYQAVSGTPAPVGWYERATRQEAEDAAALAYLAIRSPESPPPSTPPSR